MASGFGSPSQAQDRSLQGKRLQPAVDAEQVEQQWLRQFAELEDPRGRKGREHAFLSIVLIAILATIGGAEGWEDMELYAESHESWLASFLDLSNGIPHADTYRRVFSLCESRGATTMFSGLGGPDS
jgi:hypothetical protein